MLSEGATTLRTLATAGRAPLAGRRLLITRPEPECHETAQQALALGAEVLLAPALTIQSPEDPAPLLAAMERLADYDGVIVTSVNGARALLNHLPTGVIPSTLYAVGNKSAQPLQAAGLHVHCPDQPSNSVALAHAILQHQQGHFLFLRAAEGREELAQILRQAGASVDLITAYAAQPIHELPENVLNALAQQTIDVILFFSSRSALAFLNALPPERPPLPTLAVLSPAIAETLREHGLPVAVVAEEQTSGGLLSALVDFYHPLEP